LTALDRVGTLIGGRVGIPVDASGRKRKAFRWVHSWWSAVVERHAPTGGTPRPLGQRSLRGSRLAEALVRSADVSPSDFVVEIGAGTGTLTEALASRARTVVALELDRRLAAQLVHRFSDRLADGTVEVVTDDALRFPWPREPFRAFGNIPFAITTPLLRSLLDAPSLRRADLIVQWEVAVKRSVPKPRNLLNVSWGPWWTFAADLHLGRRCFRPMPSVDAGLLRIERRRHPLLPEAAREEFRRFVRLGYGKSSLPLRRSLGTVLTGRQLQRLASDLGFDPAARAIDLDLIQWVEVFRFATAR
jgi:23S rRNA (adenine-N6)-dimethyltransferase